MYLMKTLQFLKLVGPTVEDTPERGKCAKARRELP
jgi:hypothetical protein